MNKYLQTVFSFPTTIQNSHFLQLIVLHKVFDLCNKMYEIFMQNYHKLKAEIKFIIKISMQTYWEREREKITGSLFSVTIRISKNLHCQVDVHKVIGLISKMAYHLILFIFMNFRLCETVDHSFQSCKILWIRYVLIVC